MENLKEILETHISLCNKSNILEIILGKITSPSIFNTSIYSEKNIKSLFQSISNSEIYNHSIITKNLKRFYYENKIIDSIIKNQNQTILNQYQKDISPIITINNLKYDIQLQKVVYSNETLIINSPSFNHTEEIEELEITINNSFSVIIEKTTGFLCKIQIYKPINIDIILDFLKLFPTSSYS
jgi:hypothetical protein